MTFTKHRKKKNSPPQSIFLFFCYQLFLASLFQEYLSLPSLALDITFSWPLLLLQSLSLGTSFSCHFFPCDISFSSLNMSLAWHHFLVSTLLTSALRCQLLGDNKPPYGSLWNLMDLYTTLSTQFFITKNQCQVTPGLSDPSTSSAAISEAPARNLCMWDQSLNVDPNDPQVEIDYQCKYSSCGNS